MRALGVLLAVAAVLGCRVGWNGEPRDFRADMRDFVVAISDTAHAVDGDFIVIPQNGHALLTQDGDAAGDPATLYVDAIDGVGREDLFFGYTGDGLPTPAADRDEMLGFMDLAEDLGVQVLATDYVSDPADVTDSYTWNETRGYISFAAPSRGLDVIPAGDPFGLHGRAVATLDEAANFLYLLDPSGFGDRAAYLDALAATDYDALILDLYFDEEPLTADEVQSLRTKAGGAGRLVIAYMSIGEAESYRPYWKPVWAVAPPAWLLGVNPDWPGNYRVEYWDPEWQALILDGTDGYLGRILEAGFDGVYLDIIDAYEYFESF